MLIDISWITLKRDYITPKTVQYSSFAAYVGLVYIQLIFICMFNDEYTSKWPLLLNGQGTKVMILRGWMSLLKWWLMALTTIPYKTKQLTFKMVAVNAAPFPNAISLQFFNLICKLIMLLWISSNELTSGLGFKSIKKKTWLRSLKPFLIWQFRDKFVL